MKKNIILSYNKALTRIQKGFDKKSKQCSEKSIEFVKGLLIKTIEDFIVNSMLPMKLASEFYFKDPLSKKTKRMMKLQKKELNLISDFIDILRKLNLKKIKVEDHDTYCTLHLDDKLKI